MPKKKSSKIQKDGLEKPVVAVEAKEPSSPVKEPSASLEKHSAPTKDPSPPAKRPKDEIDEIFASKKRNKSEQEEEERHTDIGSVKPKKTKKRKKDRGLREEERDKPSRPRGRTNDGLAIYSEKELGINNADAGGTPLCPFDCSCCF